MERKRVLTWSFALALGIVILVSVVVSVVTKTSRTSHGEQSHGELKHSFNIAIKETLSKQPSHAPTPANQMISPNLRESPINSLTLFPSSWNQAQSDTPSILVEHHDYASTGPVATSSPTIGKSPVPIMDEVVTTTPSGEIHKQSNTPSTLEERHGPESLPFEDCPLIHFYAIADVPYNETETAELPGQIAAIPEDAEFLIHLGDVRSAKEGFLCTQAEYQAVASMLTASKVPVFIILGDNEWNDCPNMDGGWHLWHNIFGYFEDQWNHNFNVIRQENRGENFAFVHKNTLFIGLNIVGGKVHSQAEWHTRLTDNANWMISLLKTHTGGEVNTVILFGHANPTVNHDDFFFPIRQYMNESLPRSVKVLYLNGDGHAWKYEPAFFEQENFLRIQLTGGTTEPPLKMVVDPSAKLIRSTFLYDRRLL